MNFPIQNSIKGRGAQKNISNRFFKESYHLDEDFTDYNALDEESYRETIYQEVETKQIVNKVESPDIGLEYSVNPYQGCEHGCTYCYARYSHHYWGYNSGLDFEKNILVKKNAAKSFENFISKSKWSGRPITLSGNTDCYQPIERKLKITRDILKIADKYNQPVSIITKNALVCRDIDILGRMAERNLCRVFLSINSLDETLVRKMEPRTSGAQQRINSLKKLSEQNIPVGIMNAPIVPGLNDHEIPKVLEVAKKNGAKWANYTIVRLNGDISEIFKDWLQKTYPDKSPKVLNQVKACHNGKLNDSRFGDRVHGTGVIAKLIRDTFRLHCKIQGLNKEKFTFNCQDLKRGDISQLSLF